MWLLSQVSRIFMCDVSFLGVTHMSYPPTTLLCLPVELSVSYFLYFLGIALPLLTFYSHQCLDPLP